MATQTTAAVSSGLLRICTAGSVDDGKSTLIGRLLYDSRAVYEDQLTSVKAASRNRSAGPIDFSLFTDGLRAEREQGITIDVAYRYFATARRKFILADTPGHEQYTRNMATGASTADLAILLVDARHGVREQTRRHARIAAAARHLELRPRRQQDGPGRLRSRRVRRICDDFAGLRRRRRVHADPDERAARRQRHHAAATATPWFTGPPLLEYLETVESVRQGRGQLVPLPGAARAAAGPRVSRLRRPDRLGDDPPRRRDHRLAVGPPRPGHAHRHVGRRSRSGARADVGHAGARGRTRHQPRRRAGDQPAPSSVGRFAAHVVWMDERPLDPRRMYLLKHATRVVTAELDSRSR